MLFGPLACPPPGGGRVGYTKQKKEGITIANVKTEISIQESLFEQVENMAQEMNVSRSRVFAMAVEEFLRVRQNRQLLAALNEAYGGDTLTSEAEQYLKRMRQSHRKVVAEEW